MSSLHSVAKPHAVLLTTLADSQFLSTEFSPLSPYWFTVTLSFNLVNVYTIVIVCTRLNVMNAYTPTNIYHVRVLML